MADPEFDPFQDYPTNEDFLNFSANQPNFSANPPNFSANPPNFSANPNQLEASSFGPSQPANTIAHGPYGAYQPVPATGPRQVPPNLHSTRYSRLRSPRPPLQTRSREPPSKLDFGKLSEGLRNLRSQLTTRDQLGGIVGPIRTRVDKLGEE
jgi:hypothetical protein